MREVITIGVGGFGINVTDTFTQGVAEEHGLTNPLNEENNELIENSYPDIFFEESSKGQWTSRGLLIDADSMGIDQIRSSRSGQELYGIDNFCCGRNSFGSLFAKGRYGDGKELVECAMDKIRGQIESCDCLQGFLFTYGLGGGAGSGMGAEFLDKIFEFGGDKMFIANCLYPSKPLTNPLEIYNSVLGHHRVQELSCPTIMYDNQSVLKHCMNNYQTDNASQGDLNYIISQHMLGISSSFRFRSDQTFDYRKIATSLIYFPRQHYLATSFSGEHLSTLEQFQPKTKLKADNLAFAKQLFHFNNSLIGIQEQGRIMTYFAQFRGDFHTKLNIYETLRSLYTECTTRFCCWIPDSRCFGIQKPIKAKKQLNQASLLINTVQVKQIFVNMLEDFNTLYKTKQYLHKYISEGMDEEDFQNAKYILDEVAYLYDLRAGDELQEYDQEKYLNSQY